MAFVNCRLIVLKTVNGVKKLLANLVSLDFFYSFGTPIASYTKLKINIAVSFKTLLIIRNNMQLFQSPLCLIELLNIIPDDKKLLKHYLNLKLTVQTSWNCSGDLISIFCQVKPWLGLGLRTLFQRLKSMIKHMFR